MAKCKHCGRSGLLVWTGSQGLCKKCKEEIWQKVKAERERVKEAMIFARVLKDPLDRVFHLQRALDSVKTLSRYERLGCTEMSPRPQALLDLLEQRLEDVRAEHGVAGAEPQRSGAQEARPADTGGQATKGTRRVARKPIAFRVRVAGDARARAEDISTQGLRLRSSILLKPGTRVGLMLDAPLGVLLAEGMVRWAHRVKQAEKGQSQVVMGLEFSTPQPELKRYG